MEATKPQFNENSHDPDDNEEIITVNAKMPFKLEKDSEEPTEIFMSKENLDIISADKLDLIREDQELDENH